MGINFIKIKPESFVDVKPTVVDEEIIYVYEQEDDHA